MTNEKVKIKVTLMVKKPAILANQNIAIPQINIK